MSGTDQGFQKESPSPAGLVLNQASLFNEVAGISRFANQRGREGLVYVGGNADHFLLGEFLGAQEASFGNNLTNAEIIQLLKEGAGKVYFAHDKYTQTKVGYAIIQTAELNEMPVQVELETRTSSQLFHDHLDYGLPNNTVLFADLGITKEYQNQGWGSVLTSLVKKTFEDEYGKPFWMAFARFNNPSLIIATRILGMSMIGVQGPSRQGLGSKENNFRGDSIIPSVDDLPPDSKLSAIWQEGDPRPSGKHFFLPMIWGEQEDLDNSRAMVSMLKMSMAYGRRPAEREDYVMRKVCKPEELRRLEIVGVKPEVPYLFFTKDWKYGVK